MEMVADDTEDGSSSWAVLANSNISTSELEKFWLAGVQRGLNDCD